MTLKQGVNLLLNQNYRPLDIWNAAKEIEKNAATNSAPKVQQSR